MGWDQFDDDAAEYHKRRNALTPAASAVMTFNKEPTPSGNIGPKLVEGMKNCAGVGANDSPAGRRDVYKQICFPLGDATEQSKATGKCPEASSCGLFIRGMWQLYGIGAPKDASAPNRGFRSAYQDGTVIVQIGRFGLDCRALHGKVDNSTVGTPLDFQKDILAWQPGDHLFILNTKPASSDEGTQHIFTIVEAAKLKHQIAAIKIFEVLTVDGGQFGGGDDGGCRSIKTTSKLFRSDGFKITMHNFTAEDKWQIGWWVEAAKLTTSEPEILIPQIQQKMPGAKFPP
jgi:hypothetical protein